VPDRTPDLHPLLLPTLQELGVDCICHAGDICAPQVIKDLEQIAPVIAVRGNRDWLLAQQLPMVQRFQLGGVSAALLHGHGSVSHYLWDKVHYATVGYKFERYYHLIRKTVPDARVVIFGHTHRPEIFEESGQLIFNPGSACKAPYPGSQPSMGVLRIYQGGKVEAEVISLPDYQLNNRKWDKI